LTRRADLTGSRDDGCPVATARWLKISVVTNGGMDMRVLLAGASGAIGMPLIQKLHAAGHDVLAIHRAPQGRARLAATGATPLQADVLSRAGLLSALDGHRADAVISELTALKKPPTAHKDMAATNKLRTEGTANLIVAARHVGARRFLTQSMVFGYGYGDWAGRVLTEADSFGPPGHGHLENHVAAMRSNEQQVFSAAGLDGIALRYGLFYGPGPACDALIDGLGKRRIPIVRNSGCSPGSTSMTPPRRPSPRLNAASRARHTTSPMTSRSASPLCSRPWPKPSRRPSHGSSRAFCSPQRPTPRR
jgi:NAD-dependent epimerase/dehydratase family protein